MLAARAPRTVVTQHLRRCYPGIKFVTKAKYLGLLMGPEISTVDIFQAAVDKFYARARQLHRVVRASTLHQRILIYNIYLLPILFYLAQFYIIPFTEMIRPIRNHCRKAIGAFNGGAFGYCHLINTPRDTFGPHTPLRDLWATNMALLAERSSVVGASHGHDIPQMGNFGHVPGYAWGSLIIAEHEAWCAWALLHDFGPRDGAQILQTEHFKGAPTTRRRLLYRQLVYHGYWQERDVDKKRFPTSLPCKLRRFFPTASPQQMSTKVANLKDNLKLAGAIPRPGQWNAWFRFTTNALPTDRRMAAAGLFPTNRNPRRPQACFFCKHGKDDVRHIFGRCRPIKKALHAAAQGAGLRLPSRASMRSLATLTTPTPQPASPLFAVLIITFVWAVWSDRLRFFSALEHPPSSRKVVTRLVEYTLTHLPRPRIKRITPAAVIELANNPPPEALVGFSDGSSIPNPGPCGAGALLILPHGAGQALCAMSLGQGDNNLGEIAGTHQVLRLLDEAYKNGRIVGHPPLLLFTDSLLVVGALEWGWSARNMPPLIRDLRCAYRERKSLNPVALYWVKGHSNITHNETVDQEAKTGARWSLTGAIRIRTVWTPDRI